MPLMLSKNTVAVIGLFLGIFTLPNFADEVEKDGLSTSTNNPLKVTIHPVFGKYGSRRSSAYLPGEQMYFAGNISGLAADSAGNYDFESTFSLADPSGNIIQHSSSHKNELFCLGEGVFSGSLGCITDPKAPAGQYVFRTLTHDKITNQTVEKELAINLLNPNRISIYHARFYHNEDFIFNSSGSSNITLGENLYSMCYIRVPKTKNNKAIAKLFLTIFDNNNKVITKTPETDFSFQDIKEDVVNFDSHSAISIYQAGCYRLRIEAKDVSTNETDKCDLPFTIHQNPMPPTANNRPLVAKSPRAEGSGESPRASDDSGLSIDIHPTTGILGGPHEWSFISGEPQYVTLIVSGVPGNSKTKPDITINCMVLDSPSPARENNENRMMDWYLAHNHTLVLGTTLLERAFAEPGDYTERYFVKDNISNKTVTKDIAFTILDSNRFDIGGLGLYLDKEERTYSGPNLTVGDKIFAKCSLFVPNKFKGHEVEFVLSYLNADRIEISREKPRKVKTESDSSSIPYCKFDKIIPFVPNRTGAYYLRFELKDNTSRESVKKDMPFQVHLPPELPEVNDNPRAQQN